MNETKKVCCPRCREVNVIDVDSELADALVDVPGNSASLYAERPKTIMVTCRRCKKRFMISTEVHNPTRCSVQQEEAQTAGKENIETLQAVRTQLAALVDELNQAFARFVTQDDKDYKLARVLIDLHAQVILDCRKLTVRLKELYRSRTSPDVSVGTDRVPGMRLRGSLANLLNTVDRIVANWETGDLITEAHSIRMLRIAKERVEEDLGWN